MESDNNSIISNNFKRKAVKGLFWSSLERFSVQGAQFIVMLIMARLLSPSDYGIVGMLTIFLAISQSLIDSGFSQALIRKHNRTELDNSTVFYFNIAIGIILYLLLYITAPLIANFYNVEELKLITRVLSLCLIFNSFLVVQRALLTAKIDFKTQSKATLSATIMSGTAGITLAYLNYGVWSLVVQQLLNTLICCVLLWYYSSWRPIKVFSKASFWELFNFGSKLVVSGIIDTIYKNIYLIVIGKYFNSSSLGYYTRAHQFAEFPSSNITGILQRVTYPLLCGIQNDEIMLSITYRKILRISAFIVFPFMIGLAALSEPFILIVLKERWLFVASLLPIICLSMMWYPIHAINLNMLQVKGRADLFLKLEIWKKLIGFCIICITIPFGITAICIGSVVSSLFALVINTYYTGKLIKVGFLIQIKDLLPILFYSLSMGGVVLYGTKLIESNLLKIIIGVLIGIIYYITISNLCKSRELKEVIQLIRNKI